MELIVKQTNFFKENFSFLDYQPYFYRNCQYNNRGINEENLKQLADFSETIEEPRIIGKFNNEQHYLKSLELVLNSTQETQNRIIFFKNKILPMIFTKDSLLDIGPGDGSLTRLLATHFKNITVVDSNQYILNTLEQKLPSSINCKKINKNILDIEFKSDSYNLAVLSHMLYYIEPIFWFRVIKAVYKSLKENGILVIVMGGDELGKAALINNFGGQILKIDQLALECRSVFGANSTSFYASNEVFAACSKKAMFHISAFMLGDSDITATRKDLNRYIEKKFQLSEKYFEMTTRQKYIVIRKLIT